MTLFDKAWALVDQSIHKNTPYRDSMIQKRLFDFQVNEKQILKERRPLRVFESFTGASGHPNVEAGWTKEAKRRGHDVKLGEYETQWYEPDLPGDILQYTAQDILDLYGGEAPDLFCASPPCEGFSIAGAISSNWDDWTPEKKRAFNIARYKGDSSYFDDLDVGPIPSSERAHRGRRLLNHTLNQIDDLLEVNPNMLYFVENPTGMMRYQPEIGRRNDLLIPSDLTDPQYRAMMRGGNPPPSITHSSYSGPLSQKLVGRLGSLPGHPIGALPSRKATDLFTNASPYFQGRRRSRNKFDAGIYHAPAPRGAKTGIQGLEDYTDPETGVEIPKYWLRSLIPYELGVDVIDALERMKYRGNLE